MKVIDVKIECLIGDAGAGAGERRASMQGLGRGWGVTWWALREVPLQTETLAQGVLVRDEVEHPRVSGGALSRGPSPRRVGTRAAWRSPGGSRRASPREAGPSRGASAWVRVRSRTGLGPVRVMEALRG